MKEKIFSEIVLNNFRRERLILSRYACKNSRGIRKYPEREKIPDRENIRPVFFHDTDKIIHSKAYTRYIDKTQVFSLFENDHITHRVLHVQFVSKIARVIGRCLKLNEDLIEAISLGHDLGHVPYGHDGEKVLHKICVENNIGCFYHNAQSVRFLMEIEKGGEGLNLSLQVLDGILAHNGEMLHKEYRPGYEKSWDKFEEEYRNCFIVEDYGKKIVPMTLEGCVVRISDVIAYIGRDIEDAIAVRLIKKEQIPYGWLIFGVSDKTRKIAGTGYRPNRSDLDSLKSEIANKTTNRITFIEIYELLLPEGRVIMFQIPAAPKGIPVAWEGHYYGRDGESIGALNLQEFEQIRSQGNQYDWSAQICEGATIDDLDPTAIVKARQNYREKLSDKAPEVDSWDDPMFLNKPKITIQGKITRTAIILLGRDESEHFLSPSVAKITWVLKDENNIEKDYEHFGPPFLLNVESVYAKIRNLRYRYLLDSSLFPTEVTKYEPWVIREVLNNCIAHQDYELRGRISVVENPDDLIFTNLGKFIPESVERVIEQDAPPEQYRNPFLANAMVNLKMIDTLGGGIKKMFLLQRQRYFPMPDYDLSEPEKVKVRIIGKVIDERYTKLLINKTDLSLKKVICLDKVQKRIRLTPDEYKLLRSQKLVEGRSPNLFVTAQIAAITGEKSSYIRYRAFDKKYYKEMVIELIKKFDSASRQDIDRLLLSKLPDILDEKQKLKKINNLLNEMSRKDKTIRNFGTKRTPVWVLT